jgi:hypothetical protein
MTRIEAPQELRETEGQVCGGEGGRQDVGDLRRMGARFDGSAVEVEVSLQNCADAGGDGAGEAAG